MDEDNLNIEIRKFLKKVGITSQREIENYIRKKFSEGDLKEGQSLEIKMELSFSIGRFKAINWLDGLPGTCLNLVLNQTKKLLMQ